MGRGKNRSTGGYVRVAVFLKKGFQWKVLPHLCVAVFLKKGFQWEVLLHL